jgi:hypothetical protein
MSLAGADPKKRLYHAHQIRDLAAERERQPDDGRKRRRLDASFEVVDVRERHLRLLREGSHGFAALVPKLAQTLAEELRFTADPKNVSRWKTRPCRAGPSTAKGGTMTRTLLASFAA